MLISLTQVCKSFLLKVHFILATCKWSEQNWWEEKYQNWNGISSEPSSFQK